MTNQHGTTTRQGTEMNFIPESDVYRLAFQSKLPGAEAFTDWVTEEVLPTIHMELDAMLRDPQYTIQRVSEELQERYNIHISKSAVTVIPSACGSRKKAATR